MVSQERNRENGRPGQRTTTCVSVDRWIELVLAFAIAGAAITQCSVANRQWEVMSDTNQISTRPYINILSDTFKFYEQFNSPLRINLTIENYGKLPAHARIQGGIAWQTASHPAEPPVPSSKIGSIFLFPGGPSDQFTLMNLGGIGVGGIAELKSGTDPSLYISVRVMYGPDSNPVERETGICTQFQIERNGGLRLGRGAPCGGDAFNYTR